MWSKPSPSKDWPLREDLHDQGQRVGKIYIRKQTYEKVERGITHFLARGFLLVKNAGPGLVDIGDGNIIAPMSMASGTPFMNVKVEYSADDYWMWLCDRAYDALKCKTYPCARWII